MLEQIWQFMWATAAVNEQLQASPFLWRQRQALFICKLRWHPLFCRCKQQGLMINWQHHPLIPTTSLQDSIFKLRCFYHGMALACEACQSVIRKFARYRTCFPLAPQMTCLTHIVCMITHSASEFSIYIIGYCTFFEYIIVKFNNSFKVSIEARELDFAHMRFHRTNTQKETSVRATIRVMGQASECSQKNTWSLVVDFLVWCPISNQCVCFTSSE